jgi:tetratricopeptide (TPR) repeat protein
MDWDADELLVLARLDLQKDNIQEALEKLKQARLLPSSTPTISLELARLYAQIGLRPRAIPLFIDYLREAPSDTDARFQLGMAHFEEGDTRTAMETWDAVLEADSQYPPAMFYRALALSQGGSVDQSKDLLRRAIDVLPTDNLYFGRARELLTTLENGGGRTGTPGTTDTTRKH